MRSIVLVRLLYLSIATAQRSMNRLTYYDMALACGIKMMPSRLITIDGRSHFITERFERAGNEKLHIQTLAAMSPDADCYEVLMKTARLLRIPDNELADIFRIAAFNVLAANVDDHNKNFSLHQECIFYHRRGGICRAPFPRLCQSQWH